MWPLPAILLLIKTWGPLVNFVLLSMVTWFVFTIRANDMKHMETFLKVIRDDVKYMRIRLDRHMERNDGKS